MVRWREVVAKTLLGLLACDAATLADSGARCCADANPATYRTSIRGVGHSCGPSSPVVSAVFSAERIRDVVEEAEVVGLVDSDGVRGSAVFLVEPSS